MNIYTSEFKFNVCRNLNLIKTKCIILFEILMLNSWKDILQKS